MEREQELLGDGCFTIEEAVRFSGLGRSFLYEQMKAGRLPYVKVAPLGGFPAGAAAVLGRAPGGWARQARTERRPEMQAIGKRRLRAVMVLNGDTVRSLAAKLLHPSTSPEPSTAGGSSGCMRWLPSSGSTA